MRPHGVLVCTLSALLLVLSGPPVTAASARVPAYHPDRLVHLADAGQVVVVTSSGWRSSHATLRAYAKDRHGRWQLRMGPWAARVGYNGMAPAGRRRQGTGTTPAGTFGLGRAFGSRPDPGTSLAGYRRFDNNDYWVYDPRDPATYNVLQRSRSADARWRTSWAERLADWGDRQYAYAVVIGFNLPSGVHWSRARQEYVASRPADTSRGGGIFLHVNGAGATAGCVSVGLHRMQRLLRWLDADRGPRIVIGPRAVITRM